MTDPSVLKITGLQRQTSYLASADLVWKTYSVSFDSRKSGGPGESTSSLYFKHIFIRNESIQFPSPKCEVSSNSSNQQTWGPAGPRSPAFPGLPPSPCRETSVSMSVSVRNLLQEESNSAPQWWCALQRHEVDLISAGIRKDPWCDFGVSDIWCLSCFSQWPRSDSNPCEIFVCMLKDAEVVDETLSYITSSFPRRSGWSTRSHWSLLWI